MKYKVLFDAVNGTDADPAPRGIVAIGEMALVAGEVLAFPAPVYSLGRAACPLETVLGSASVPAVGHASVLAQAAGNAAETYLVNIISHTIDDGKRIRDYHLGSYCRM